VSLNQPEDIQILLVEDTLTQAMYMQHALTQAGYKVTIARSGEKALETLEKFIPDVVLTDINMPGINGYELIKAVKQAFANMKTLILVTAGQTAEVVEILNSGADGLVFKSSNQKRFVAQVKLALSQGQNGNITLAGEELKIAISREQQEKINHFLLSAYQQIIDLQTQ